ncbi:MAG: site-2 protease family protein [Planctomycetaceae bacterium]
MKGTFKLGRIAGIDVFVHWTFLLLVGWFVLIFFGAGGAAGAARGLLLLIALFGCVVLHELGHALTARRYGVKTRDITLLPIGGVARLERIPDDPHQELMIAIAGPIVNFAIAGVLAIVILLMGAFSPLEAVVTVTGPFLQQLLWFNVIIGGFNLLPAFPMDGGRILRSILARYTDYVTATETAARVGQGMAILFGILGLLVFNIFLIFIALFVYLGAQAEAHSVQIRAVVRGVPVKAAMMTRFQTLSQWQTLGAAADEVVAGAQQDFPVFDDGECVGLLYRRDLFHALTERGRDVPVSDVMQREFPTVSDAAMLETVFEQMQHNGTSMVPVTSHGELVGLITLENVGEWVMIRSALQRREPDHEDAAGRFPRNLTVRA